MAERTFGFRTRALHAGGTPDAEHGARAVPIYQTTSFVFKDTDDAANLFALQKYGNIYSRIGNPTVAAFEERIASLEGGIGAVATSSGMAAEFITFAALAQARATTSWPSSQLYGGTVTQLDVTLRRFGVDTTFVAGTDPADYAAAIRENTKAIFAEVVANPSGDSRRPRGPGRGGARRRHPARRRRHLEHALPVRPIEHGADIVIHSATKFLGGHGTTLGGVIVESGRFNWGNGKFPHHDRARGLLRQRLLVGQLRRVRLPDQAALRAAARHRPALSPQSAFQLLQGVETLPQRMDEHLKNAAGRGRMARSRRARGLRELLRPALAPALRAGAEVPAARARARCSPSASRAAAPPGRSSSSPCSWPRHLANVGDSRTLVHPPGLHHPPAAQPRTSW